MNGCLKMDEIQWIHPPPSMMAVWRMKALQLMIGLKWWRRDGGRGS